jgi:hypothetical protein
MFFKRTHFEFVGGYAHIPKTLTFWGFFVIKKPSKWRHILVPSGGLSKKSHENQKLRILQTQNAAKAA